MWWLGAAAQCVADFLVDERCHACGARPAEIRGAPEPPVLARPVRIVCAGVLSLSTRLLCDACAASVPRCTAPVVVGGGPGWPSVALPVFPAFETDDCLLALIHLMKFRRGRALAPWLAGAMAGALPARALDTAPALPVLVPVPMDRGARARRGFNQAECMARELGRAWNVPVETRAIHKRRATRAQSSLGRDERWRNLEGAFAPGTGSVRDRTVVLVDDLVTTGATLTACAQALGEAGAAGIRAVCAGYRP